MLSAVTTETDHSALRALLVEYHGWMTDHAGDVYDPEAELAEDLESVTTGDDVWAWVDRQDEAPVGCVLLYGLHDRGREQRSNATRAESGDVAEFKRLWVRPTARGVGIGRALVRQTITTARDAGYGRLGLTTPPWSTAAHALYESLGFERTPPYPETRLPEKFHDDAIFMQRSLTDSEHEG